MVTVSMPLRGISSSTSLGVGPGDFNIDLSEGFATAWKPLGTASLLSPVLEEESGYPVPGSGPTGAGASQGTRILVDFVDESPPSSIGVPNEVSDGAALLLKRVAGADAMGAGGAVVGGAGMHIVDTSSGSGRVIYEVDQIGSFVLETVSIPADVIPPIRADIRVSAMLGPTSTINVADMTAPIPRFVEILLPVSVVTDGLISDGTVSDDDTSAEVIFPPGSPGGASEVIIDQTNDPLATPPPAGFTSVGTGFFNIELVPPDGPFCPIGITLVLPVNPALPAATMLPLLRVNETTGVLETVLDCSGSSLVGVVEPTGTTATFMGIPSLSLFVGLLPEGPGAAGLISQVDDLVENGDLRKGLDAPLKAFLKKALRAVDRGQEGLAAFFLQKFQGRVQRLVDRGELTAGAGQALIDGATAVILDL